MSDRDAHTEEDQRAVLQAERETMAAIRGKDVNALCHILADEFVYRTPGGADADKTEFLNNIVSIPVPLLAVWGEELKADVFGETAVLTGVQRARFETGDGESRVSSVAFTDVLVKRDGRWRLVLAYGVELPPAPVGFTPQE